MREAATLLLNAFDTNSQIAPLTDADPNMTLAQGYRIAGDIGQARMARGERIAGRKIGFTNTTIWPIYNVDAPVWGWMYDGGVNDIPADGVIPLPPLPEVRIEPEIVFGFAHSPEAGMDIPALMGCIDWVAHGLELVISLYPGWRFTAPDSVAAMAMHGNLWVGERQPIQSFTPEMFETCTLTLSGPGETHMGTGRDVLGSPLKALQFLLNQIDQMPGAGPIQPGEVVTTGTLTDARPIKAGQRWTTSFMGLDLPGLDVTFS